MTCALTGGVDCDRLSKEVPAAKFLHCKVMFAAGRCFDRMEY